MGHHLELYDAVVLTIPKMEVGWKVMHKLKIEYKQTDVSNQNFSI